MIIDAHCHMFTQAMAGRTLRNWIPRKAAAEKMVRSFGPETVAEHTPAWLSAMDANGVEATVFMAVAPNDPDFLAFINSSDRFYGFTNINPLQEDMMEAFLADMTAGMVGLKLYPVGRGFHVHDPRLYPVYEYCAQHQIPVAIHFGVSIGPGSDLRYGNPIDLSPVLRDFPDVNFIIPHFGAGYFREVLMLSYKRDNLYFDTSGTNNWREFLPSCYNLSEVFRRALEVIGPRRLIFGTDTRIFPDGYRTHILKEQQSILESLLNQEDRHRVMYENARELYRLTRHQPEL